MNTLYMEWLNLSSFLALDLYNEIPFSISGKHEKCSEFLCICIIITLQSFHENHYQRLQMYVVRICLIFQPLRNLVKQYGGDAALAQNE